MSVSSVSSFPASPLLDFKLLARSKPTVIESKWNVYTSISYCRVDIKLLLGMFNSTMFMFFVLSSWIEFCMLSRQGYEYICARHFIWKNRISGFFHIQQNLKKLGKCITFLICDSHFFAISAYSICDVKKRSWKKQKWDHRKNHRMYGNSKIYFYE